MILHRFHYNQEMSTVSAMESHGKTLAKHIPTETNYAQEIVGKNVWRYEPATSTKLETQVASDGH